MPRLNISEAAVHSDSRAYSGARKSMSGYPSGGVPWLYSGKGHDGGCDGNQRIKSFPQHFFENLAKQQTGRQKS